LLTLGHPALADEAPELARAEVGAALLPCRVLVEPPEGGASIARGTQDEDFVCAELIEDER